MENAALILEGGAFRSFFTMGVLDCLIDQHLEFGYVNGVSAGSLCAINYISKQKGRNEALNLKYIHDPRYVSMRNFFSAMGYLI